MREIKFRGKREDNGGWVYGAFIPDALEGSNSDLVSCGFVRQYNRDVGKMETIEVDRETVGQYTGLKDRDGVEIYEGGVLRNIDNPLVDKLPFKVVWNEYYGAWFWLALEGEDGTDHFYQSIASDCEVIGNIHDNPELMVEKK